jgi:hypothetical protein
MANLAVLQSRNVAMSDVGLQLHPETSYEEWADVGYTLRRIERWIQFALGDWLNFGKDHFGEDYLQELPLGYEATTLDNFAIVARKIPFPRRREGVSYSHHVEVANLLPGEQIAALTLARSEHNPYGMSVRQLRQFVATNGHSSDPPDTVRYCPTCKRVWPED